MSRGPWQASSPEPPRWHSARTATSETPQATPSPNPTSSRRPPITQSTGSGSPHPTPSTTSAMSVMTRDGSNVGLGSLEHGLGSLARASSRHNAHGASAQLPTRSNQQVQRSNSKVQALMLPQSPPLADANNVGACRSNVVRPNVSRPIAVNASGQPLVGNSGPVMARAASVPVSVRLGSPSGSPQPIGQRVEAGFTDNMVRNMPSRPLVVVNQPQPTPGQTGPVRHRGPQPGQTAAKQPQPAEAPVRGRPLSQTEEESEKRKANQRRSASAAERKYREELENRSHGGDANVVGSFAHTSALAGRPSNSSAGNSTGNIYVQSGTVPSKASASSEDSSEPVVMTEIISIYPRTSFRAVTEADIRALCSTDPLPRISARAITGALVLLGRLPIDQVDNVPRALELWNSLAREQGLGSLCAQLGRLASRGGCFLASDPHQDARGARANGSSSRRAVSRAVSPIVADSGFCVPTALRCGEPTAALVRLVCDCYQLASFPFRTKDQKARCRTPYQVVGPRAEGTKFSSYVATSQDQAPEWKQ